jgi:hypothetical protein
LIMANAALLVLVFWAGRATSPKNSAADDEPAPRRTRSLERSNPRESTRKSGPGAGDQEITSAMQLREVFKSSGGNYQLGAAQADLALSKMNAAELSRLVQDLAVAQAENPGYGFTLEISTACSRWAEVDPDAALRFVLSAKQASFRSAALGSLFAGMAKNDPALARAKLAEIEDPSLRRSAQASLLSALSVASPDDWVAFIKSDPSLSSRYSLDSIASEWAIDDPAKAAERLAKLPASVQADGVASIAKVWAGKDGPAAMAWAQSLTDPNQKKLALAAVAGGLAAKDPEAALASLKSLDPKTRRTGMASVFETLVDLDFDSALERASALSDPDERTAALDIISGGGGQDPFANYVDRSRTADQLTKLIAKVPSGPTREKLLYQLGNQLGSSKSGEMESMLAGYPPEDRQILQNGVLMGLSEEDPSRALEFLQSLPSGQIDPYTERRILSNLAQKDPDAALRAALDSPSEEAKTEGVSHVFAQMAMTNPEAAAQRLASLPVGSVAHNSALTSLTSRWASQDPEAARDWVAGLKGVDQSRAFDALVPAMADSNPKLAAETLGTYLNSSPVEVSDELNSAAATIVSRWSRIDPQAAEAFVESLPAGKARDYTLSQMILKK